MTRDAFVSIFSNIMTSIINFMMTPFNCCGYQISFFGILIFTWICSILLTFIWKAFGEHQGG